MIKEFDTLRTVRNGVGKHGQPAVEKYDEMWVKNKSQTGMSLKDFSEDLQQLVLSQKISAGESKKFAQYFKRFCEPTESESKPKYDDKWLKDIAESGLSKEYFLDIIILLQAKGEINSSQYKKLQLQYDEIRKEFLVTTQTKIVKYDTDWVETKAMSTMSE